MTKVITTEQNGLFDDTEVISSYGIEQAVEDGCLFDLKELDKLVKDVSKGIFSHITSNLLFSKGYMKEDEDVNVPNMLDLLNQCLRIVKRNKQDDFYSGMIELPSGQKQKVFIQLNELGRFTIMLPEDY